MLKMVKARETKKKSKTYLQMKFLLNDIARVSKLTITKHTIAAVIVSYDSRVCSPDFSFNSVQTIFSLQFCCKFQPEERAVVSYRMLSIFNHYGIKIRQLSQFAFNVKVLVNDLGVGSFLP